ncbi:MAG: 50S ribosomal protein L3 [Patescibacteria group bacterium]
MITRKIGMTSIVNDDGAMIAVTLLSASPNVVTQVKTVDSDGYQALQLGFETAKKVGKSQAAKYKKSKIDAPKVVREHRTDELPEDVKVGDQISVDSFEVGDVVDVTGTSKGKGFAGAIKRHNFHRQRKSHGAKGNTRKIGSIGSMYPQKVMKGKKMPGQYGNVQVTTEKVKVALVDTEHNVIGIAGAVPGPKKGIVVVRGAKRS